jgi:hypothetical protein
MPYKNRKRTKAYNKSYYKKTLMKFSSRKLIHTGKMKNKFRHKGKDYYEENQKAILAKKK